MINIRFAKIDEIRVIMKFIDDNWKKGHILGRDRRFFEWMYVEDNHCNFVIAIDEMQNKIYGILGFIKYNDKINPDVSAGMWKTIKSDNPMLGNEMREYFIKEMKFRMSNAPGLSKKAIRIEQLMGGGIGKLNHCYRINDLDQYNIPIINNKEILPYRKTEYNYREIFDFSEFASIISDDILKSQSFIKSKKYIKHRYFEHPIFKYIFLVIESSNIEQSLIISREVEHEGTKILRIIDYIGPQENLVGLGAWMDSILKKNTYEYVDFYNYGISKEILTNAGFKIRDDKDPNVIPDHFSPFERKNSDIMFIIPEVENFRLFKGDGDQDRPN